MQNGNTKNLERNKEMSYDSLYYINQTQLKEEYGFTQGLIDTYLPAPTRAENPRNSGWRKMKGWVRDDVERVINENEALHVKLDKLYERRRSR